MPNMKEGASLLELIIYLFLLGLLSAISFPMLTNSATQVRIELAAQEVSGVLHLARVLAIRKSTKIAVKFRTDSSGGVTYALYKDGNGNGIRNKDIDSGKDPELRPATYLSHLDQKIRFGFPDNHTPPFAPGKAKKRLTRLNDPIRFNRSDLASFSPRGSATPGSVYITDGQDRLAVVRVNNVSAKITVLYYDFETEIWR